MIEQVIFSQLVHNETYGRKVIPFLKPEYFESDIDRALFKLIDTYVQKFNAFPNKTALQVEAGQVVGGMSDEQFSELCEKIETIQPDDTTKLEWAIAQTEKFCKDRALYNAISASIKIMDDKSDKRQPGMIPQMLTEALSISFNVSLGHDFLEDSDKRWEYYHKAETRIPFDLELLNKITKGGLLKKTLNVIIAGTNVGKSLAMCHMGASHLAMGKNVLYITLEMAEEEIAMRIDGNLMNVPLDDLVTLPKDVYEKKVQKIRDRTLGKLIIEEFPTSGAGAANFRFLLNELRLKKKFVPDVIYIDYINICTSSRLKLGGSVNSYTYVKAISEELRGLAVEQNVPIVTATQFNREGYGSSDPGADDTSESFGLPMTVDLLIAMISNDELQALGQILFKQLKNRYRNPFKDRKFLIGVDYDKMRLYDLEQAAQRALTPQESEPRRAKFESFS
jgi:hypothetical protein